MPDEGPPVRIIATEPCITIRCNGRVFEVCFKPNEPVDPGGVAAGLTVRGTVDIGDLAVDWTGDSGTTIVRTLD